MAHAAKAWVAGLIAFLTALSTEWTDQAGDKLTTRDILLGLVAGLIAFQAVYWVTNSPKKE